MTVVAGFFAAATASDPAQLGCTTIPRTIKADWTNDVPEAWREHMDDKMQKLSKSGSLGVRPFKGALDGPGSKRVPLDQASISGVLQWVSDEEVRKKVSSCMAVRRLRV